MRYKRGLNNLEDVIRMLFGALFPIFIGLLGLEGRAGATHERREPAAKLREHDDRDLDKPIYAPLSIFSISLGDNSIASV